MPNRVQKSSLRKGVRPKDKDLSNVQNDVDTAFRQLLLNTPFSNGSLLADETNKSDPTDIVFDASGVVELPHRLDGAVKGMIVVDLDANKIIYRNRTVSKGRENTHVKLTASGACTAKIWVWR